MFWACNTKLDHKHPLPSPLPLCMLSFVSLVRYSHSKDGLLAGVGPTCYPLVDNHRILGACLSASRSTCFLKVQQPPKTFCPFLCLSSLNLSLSSLPTLRRTRLPITGGMTSSCPSSVPCAIPLTRTQRPGPGGWSCWSGSVVKGYHYRNSYSCFYICFYPYY